jgi:hypothetical protein
MNAASRMTCLTAQLTVAAGAFLPWLPHRPGVRVAVGALIDPRTAPTRNTAIGVGWLAVAAAICGVVALAAGRRLPVLGIAILQAVIVVCFVTVEAVNRAPQDYTAADIAPGCWLMFAGALAAIIAAVLSQPLHGSGGIER